MTWLIVEDEEDIRNIVSVMFNFWGHDTLVFPDGNKASQWLDTVSAGEYTGSLPELALLDIRMPGLTGDRIAERIRQIDSLKQMAVVMMTAYALSETEKQRIMEVSGADSMIKKPLPDMDELNSTLHQILASKQIEQSQPESQLGADIRAAD